VARTPSTRNPQSWTLNLEPLTSHLTPTLPPPPVHYPPLTSGPTLFASALAYSTRRPRRCLQVVTSPAGPRCCWTLATIRRLVRPRGRRIQTPLLPPTRPPPTSPHSQPLLDLIEPIIGLHRAPRSLLARHCAHSLRSPSLLSRYHRIRKLPSLKETLRR